VNSCCLVLLIIEDVTKTLENIIHMEKIADIRPTAELSPGILKTICDAISQEFYSWELKEDKDEAN
jgi:hypothetical protein